MTDVDRASIRPGAGKESHMGAERPEPKTPTFDEVKGGDEIETSIDTADKADPVTPDRSEPRKDADDKATPEDRR